mmetsp:Transcript_2684/g.6313  ORF Transcript_2684/g.6313 Transcript_2684/m.6313 type:complete len:180 (+) Transcript_2684:2-541(+)
MPRVCVTGASGFVGAHIVRILLEKGYDVHGTVRDKSNPDKVNHLNSLPGASEHLTLFNADLTNSGSFEEAFKGCVGVFHSASPFFFGDGNTEDDFVPPATQGTKDIMETIARNGDIKRVVLTSSMAAVAYNGNKLPSDHVYTDNDWSIESYQREIKAWYALSKTLAEKLAWDFVEKEKK